MRCANVIPSRNSMAMNVWPSYFAISYTVQILGWFSADAARASLRKRSSACGSVATSSRRNFKATKATEFDVLGLVDHTHPATAQLLDDAVVRDGLTNH